jgi:NTP pyrophosphatase (non-canonical NTP hydrolase)
MNEELTFEDYLAIAKTTAAFEVEEFSMEAMFYLACGIAGEAGEVAEKVKKLWRDSNGVLTEERRVAIVKELGDVLWYWSLICKLVGASPSQVAQTNLNKLLKRKAENKIHGDGDNR